MKGIFTVLILLSLGVVLLVACQGRQIMPVAITTVMPIPTHTPIPSYTPLPTTTTFPSATATQTPTQTLIPTATIAFPLGAGTALPFTPEPINAQNASRLTNLLSFNLQYLSSQPDSDGSIYMVNWRHMDGLLSFSPEDTALNILVYKVAPDVSVPYGTNTNMLGNGSDLGILIDMQHSGEYDLRLLTSQIPGLQVIQSELSIPNGLTRFFLLPDGRTLARHTPYHLWFIDLASGQETEIIYPGEDRYYYQYGFSSNGESLWFAENDLTQLYLLDLGNQSFTSLATINTQQMQLEIPLDWLGQNVDPSRVTIGLAMTPLSVSEDFLVSAAIGDFLYWVSHSTTNPNAGSWQTSCFARIELWRLENGLHINSLGTPQRCDNSLSAALSPDGRYVATTSDDRKIRLFRVTDGELIQEFQTQAYTSRLWIMADNQIVLAISGPGIEVWDAEEGNLLAHLTLPANLAHLAISHDERYIATVTEDGVVQFWGVAP